MADQLNLFAQETQQVAFVPDAAHVRNRLQDMLERMQSASVWPWPDSTLRLYRETVWPYLFGLLVDEDEAAYWRGKIEQEAARLDRLSQAA